MMSLKRNLSTFTLRGRTGENLFCLNAERRLGFAAN